ncbi:hypothetical protein M3J09_004584 [Ascochyta lentis]
MLPLVSIVFTNLITRGRFDCMAQQRNLSNETTPGTSVCTSFITLVGVRFVRLGNRSTLGSVSLLLL